MRGGSFRRAVAASVGLHLLLAAALVVAGRWYAARPAEPPPSRPGIETRVDLRIEFPTAETGDAVEVSVPVPAASAAPPETKTEPAAPADPVPAHTDSPEPAPSGRGPLVRVPAVPRTLRPEWLALMKRPASPAADVVEVPVVPTPLRPRPATGSDPAAVQPAGGTMAPHPRADAARLDGGSPVHGPLGAGQTIVYVLDASGSMGEWGKFDTARRALIATLRQLAEPVRFQVVVYEGYAFLPLQAPVQGCVAATADNIDRMAAAIRALKGPRGRSNHAEGLRAALALRPDIVLLFTDADDLPAATFRAVLRQAGRPAVVCAAKVGADGVGRPVELR